MSKLSGIITLAVPALLVLALDQATKAWIVAEMAPREIRVLVQGFLRLRYTENTGAAFGIFQGGGAVLSIASMAIILGIMVFAVKASHGSKLSMLALGLVLGGALGNLVDRVSLGYVRDFIEAHGVQANIN